MFRDGEAPALHGAGAFLVQILSKTASANVENRSEPSAEGGTRTPKGRSPPDFESGASTSSTTPAK